VNTKETDYEIKVRIKCKTERVLINNMGHSSWECPRNFYEVLREACPGFDAFGGKPGTTASLQLLPNSAGSATSRITTCFTPSKSTPTFSSSKPSSSLLWVFRTSNGWIFFEQGNLANRQVLEALSARIFSQWGGLQKDVSPMCSRRLRRRRWSAHFFDEQLCAML